MHEHVFVRNPELESNWPVEVWDEGVMFDTAVEVLSGLHSRGIDTIVDLTVVGLGRDIATIARLAAVTPVNIVVATGYYTLRDLPAYFGNRGPGSVLGGRDPLSRFFIADIEEGIAGTGVRAGIIKVATDAAGITDGVARVLSAAAAAHAETGVPISTHTSAAHGSGLQQLDFFRQAGVDLGRVIIGHSGDSDDLDYLKRMLDEGCTLGMDRFGIGVFVPESVRTDEERCEVVAALCRAGYASQLVLSHDAAVFSVNSPPWRRAELAPGWQMHRISDFVLPRLRDLGVSDDDLHTMLVRNPARLLGAGPADA